MRIRPVRVCICSAVLLSLVLPLAAQEKPLVDYSVFDQQIKPLLAKMTLDEKIGQMTQPDQEFLQDPADIENLFLGSVLSGGNSDPKEGNSLTAWTDMYERYQQRAIKTRLQIPLLYGVDAVHGHSNVIGAVIFPHNIGLGCTRNPELVQEIARITAVEVRATGIQWTFAPCITVPRDERWGRTYEGFSDDPQLVGLLGAAAVRGLQGKNLDQPLAVLSCSKHYLGDGGTTFGTARDGQGLDQGDTRVSEDELRRVHLAPYVPAIRAGTASIMPSYSSWNGVKMSGNKYLLTDVLKQELGFTGFLISDYNAIDQITEDYKTCIKISINAGMDMVMVPSNYRNFIQLLKELVEEGEVPMSRIDDAVTRILRVKAAMGLLDDDWSPKADRRLHELVGCEKHRQVGRKAVRESLVLLKNENQLLPLSKNTERIHVAGKNADDLGNQCGGWTIAWQGASGQVTTGGTTILSGIKQSVSEQTQVTYSKDGKGAEGADLAIVVIGETPYAEFEGDRADLKLDAEDLQTIANIKETGIPICVVLVSGRPMIINDVVEQADAFLAAWLPGTEGQGVADVLFGDYAPTGKLSFTWPRSMDQLPINRGDANPLFEFGFGLGY
jgi:beta-glucosidase